MLDVVTSSYGNTDDHFYTGLAFVNLKKAFDTVSHNILLTKLNNYGNQGVAYTLIRSYLDNRQQFVSINQSQSNLKPIRVGVPQQRWARSRIRSGAGFRLYLTGAGAGSGFDFLK